MFSCKLASNKKYFDLFRFEKILNPYFFPVPQATHVFKTTALTVSARY
jgi:hypothetical protein